MKGNLLPVDYRAVESSEEGEIEEEEEQVVDNETSKKK